MNSVYLLLIGLGLRLAAWWLADNPLIDDGAIYWQIAQNINYFGKYFGTEGMFFRPPFYPVFLSVFINSVSVAIFGQIVISLLTAYLIYKIVWRLSSPRKALIAFGAYCLSLELSLFSVILMSETLLLFLIVLGFYWRQNSRKKYIYISSLAWGLAVLTRPIVMLPLAAIFIFDFLNRREAAITSIKSRIFPFILFLLLPFIWSLNVSIKAGYPVFISTNSGLNLYIAHNPSSSGSYDKETEKILHIFDGLNEFEKNRQYKNMAVAYVKTHPWQTLQTTAKKPFYLFASFGGSAEGVIIRSIEKTCGLRNVAKILYSSLHLTTYWLILLLSVFHLIYKRKKVFKPFYAYCLVYFISLLPFFVFPRFRVPLMPFLIIFASDAVAELKKADLKKTAKTAIIFGMLIVRDLYKIFDFLRLK
jgi:4-amino-4-deoxy-L-arabinose transferase-like glycosyltransferase